MPPSNLTFILTQWDNDEQTGKSEKAEIKEGPTNYSALRLVTIEHNEEFSIDFIELGLYFK